MLISFRITNQIIRCVGKPEIVADSKNYLYAEFIFTPDWDGITKTALFKFDDTPYAMLLGGDNTCVVPAEVIKSPSFIVSVVGGDRITTNSVKVLVIPSGYEEGETPEPPTPDIYEQIIEMMRQQGVDAAAALEAQHAAEAAKDTAETARDTALLAAEDAASGVSALLAGYVTNAQTARTGAETAKNQASGFADSANTSAQNAASAAVTALNAKIVDNLTTDDATKVLSAKQGRALNDAKADKLATYSPGNILVARDGGGYTDSGVPIKMIGTHRYGARWDKIDRKLTRLGDAESITTNTINFGHFGSVNANYSNPFDKIYPWSERKCCDVDITQYYNIMAGGYDIRNAVSKWEGDPGFSFAPAAGHMIGIYTPVFWHTAYDSGGYRYFWISDAYMPGWTEAEATIGGRWWGVLETLEISGVSKTVLGCRPGMPATSIAISTLHTYAENAGMTIDDIYSFDATTMLAIVEYANMNTQEAVGSGCSGLYRQSADKIQTAAASTNVVQVLTANAGMCRLNAIIDIGTSDGGRQIANRYITAVAVDESAPTLTNVTISGDPIAVTADHFWSIHGCINIADADIGNASGYIGTNGYCNAYYRGQVIHANLWRYILGAYREKDTGHIWVAKSRTEAEAYNALNKSVHRDTGLVLPQGAGGAATSGYLNKLGLTPGLSCPPFCTEGGGNSSNPVGDYYSVPTIDTVDTVLLACGYASNGTFAGRFCGSWSYAASDSNWTVSAVPLSKSPNRGA